MITKQIEKLLNEQVEKEFYSSNLYLSMSIWAANNGYEGVSQWMRQQSLEEYTHMQKFVDFLVERGAAVKIPAIGEPPTDFKDLKNLFEETLKHEQYISKCISEIAHATLQEKDYSTNNWVAFFVTEQIEEEAAVRQLLDKLKLAGEHFIYAFDKDIMGIRAQNKANTPAQ